MTISKDFQTAVEHLETLRANFIRICDAYPSHRDPENRYGKGHYDGYLAALGAAINLIRTGAEMNAKYGIPDAREHNDNADDSTVINLIEALKRTENPDYE